MAPHRPRRRIANGDAVLTPETTPQSTPAPDRAPVPPGEPRLREADEALLNALRALLGPEGVREGPDAAPWLREPRDRLTGRAALIARPADAEQTARILRLCAEARVPVVPHAGGTGLVGGQLAPQGMAPEPAPVVLSVDRMNRIRQVSPEDDAMIVEAGVILADAQAAAEAADRLFPLSLASEGSARIGGLLATNAGGVNVLRYGNARDLTLGIEAALPDGSVLRGLKLLRKDNAGYDLRHLLIGSEGTLGVITAAALRLFPRPAERAAAWLGTPSPETALALLHLLRGAFAEQLTAFELMHRTGMDFLAERLPDLRQPMTPPPEWAVLAEVSGPAGSAQRPRLEAALAEAVERGLAADGVLAESEAQRAQLWRVREAIPEANRKVGAISSHDVSAPLSRIARFIALGREAIGRIDPALRINCFGHLGDGNLHYNVFPPKGASRGDYERLRGRIQRTVHDLVAELGGSFSAEHGVGRLKTADLRRYGDPAALRMMAAIKRAVDPAGVMNPGAALPGDPPPAAPD